MSGGNKRTGRTPEASRNGSTPARPRRSEAATPAASPEPTRTRQEPVPTGSRRGRRGAPTGWILGGVATLALSVSIGMNVDLVGKTMAFDMALDGASPGTHQRRAVATAAEQPPTALETLPCFQCHAIARFHEGGDFSHDLHQEEDIGHCHICHALEGHFRVTVREATCEECH